MTLTEAILHAEEVAEEKQLKANNLKQCKDYGVPKSTITSGVAECETCAEEHRQLAEWLKELKAYKADEEHLKSCFYCGNRKSCKDYLEGVTSYACDDWEPCEDAISRAQAVSDYADWYGYGYRDSTFYKHLKNMPPVQPTSKTGQWEEKTCYTCDLPDGLRCENNRICTGCDWSRPYIKRYCSKCGCVEPAYANDFCPNCGAKMESEERNADSSDTL